MQLFATICKRGLTVRRGKGLLCSGWIVYYTEEAGSLPFHDTRRRKGIRMEKSTERKTCMDAQPTELDRILTCSHTKRCLIKAGITTLDQLMRLWPDDLLRIRGIGPVIAKDIVKAREHYAERIGGEEQQRLP